MSTLKSYESLVREFGKTSNQTRAMQTAINERGGHCKLCVHCKAQTAVLPAKLSARTAHQANYSVHIQCEIDPLRIYPHRAEHSSIEDCPSIWRDANHQDQQVQQPQAA